MTTLIANPDWIAAARKCVQDAPFPNLVGIELTAVDFDSCRLDLIVGERHMQPFGIVHGGVIATLIDSATFWAAYLRLPEDTGLVNVDLKLNYLTATTSGRMTVHSRCLRAGRQLSYTEASVVDQDGDLVAHGTSTLMARSGTALQLGVAKFLEV
ncbi:MAG TPA: PaaI family thioesterase [Jatrophihabitantaceae bacterium]|jgi:uncharacterized protein (TIGR00369 family)|nr:PaaI family thioesterase [Jatrophihabitantaceae bacterium]